MRNIATLHPQESIPIGPDTVQTLLIAGSSGQTLDLPGTSVGSSGFAGGIVRFSGMSTAGASLNFYVSIGTTKCAAPSSGQSTEGTTGFGYPVMTQGTYQVPPGSTCWSVAALSSGYITAEFWKKGG